MFSTLRGATRLSLIVIIGLVTAKLVVAVITGGISILAQGIDSLLDLLAVAITFYAIKIAAKPADKEHPFGHGKVENIAAVGQAALIFAAGGCIIYAAIHKIIVGATVELTSAGIGVMIASIIASILLSRHLLKVARATDSIALEANAHNIAADVYSAAAVLGGLIAIRFTGLNILDPIIALGISVLIIKAAYGVLKKSFGPLIDTKLPKAEEDTIRSCIMEQGYQLVDFHDLRTRKAGAQRYVELHLTVPKDVNVEEAHQICDRIEQCIKARLPNTSVTTHVEPCSGECEQCTASCTLRDRK
jgi:cation diffusion facilitator family transporter